jgi:hypothetical protein
MSSKEIAGASEQAIREHAYFLWEQNGRPAGRELEFWSHAAASLAAIAPDLAKRRKSAAKATTKPRTRAKSAA